MQNVKASDYYLGKDGYPRLNCAQSILATCGASEPQIAQMSAYSGGRAPDGWCGAAYAAAYLLNDKKTVEEFFIANAGAVKCREIRSNRKLSCADCVDRAAELVQSTLQS